MCSQLKTAERMFQDCSCSYLMGNGTKVNTRGKQTAQREMQEYDLHHIKPLFALLMKYLTPLVWRFQGSDRGFLYNTWKSLFVPHAIGKCWQDELLKPVGCSLRANSEPRDGNNPYEGLAGSGLLCRVTGRSFESPSQFLVTMAWFCARLKTSAVFWDIH